MEGTHSYIVNSNTIHGDNISFSNYYDGYFENYAYKTKAGAERAIVPMKKKLSCNIDDFKAMALAKSEKEKDRIKMKAALKNDSMYEVIPLKQMYIECVDKYPKMNNIEWVKERIAEQ